VRKKNYISEATAAVALVTFYVQNSNPFLCVSLSVEKRNTKISSGGTKKNLSVISAKVNSKTKGWTGTGLYDVRKTRRIANEIKI